MNVNELLIEAHKILDAATVEDELNHESMCMYYLGKLHGSLIQFCESKPQNLIDDYKPSHIGDCKQ